MRDLPGPSGRKGLIAPSFVRIFAWPYRLGLAGLYRAGFRPWQLTLLSLAGNGIVAWLFVTGRRFLPGMLLLPAGLLDVFDGGIARLRGEASRAGAFLDSVADRASDLAVFGCLFWSLAGEGDRLTAALTLVALGTSFLVSYTRAEAEALNLSLSEGMVQRLERYVALMVGLTAPGTLVWVMGALAALGAATAVQRFASAWIRLRPGSEPD